MFKLKYRYLLDERGYRVGRVYVNHKVIVFDDQEIVAVLDYKSNRNKDYVNGTHPIDEQELSQKLQIKKILKI